MGDIRHLCDDIVHHHGIVTKENTGRCKLLRWFEPGDSILIQGSQPDTAEHHQNRAKCLTMHERLGSSRERIQEEFDRLTRLARTDEPEAL